jgi:predicted hotdog family 3-hydroxylacyl-ACP dehydratase
VDEGLIPHRAPWRLVQAVAAVGEKTITCTGRIPRAALPDWPVAPAFVGIELAAQAAAVLEALERARAGGAQAERIGYLVSVREAEIAVGELPFDQELVATVRQVADVPPLRLYEAKIECAGVVCLRALLGTYLA